MNKLIIKNAQLVNEGQIIHSDVLINGEKIERIDRDISAGNTPVYDALGQYLLPGCIDDQVHFREPGLTHKASIASESAAALAGGVTSFMEMPNTIPNALTRNLLEDKYQIAAKTSFANYSFYMGVSNDNLDEILSVNYEKVCGIKVFMGSSTGNMLVDLPKALEALFREAPVLIATHCEDEKTVLRNLEKAKSKYGEAIPVTEHPKIRSREACEISSKFAIELAKKYHTRLHILHISTEEETALFEPTLDLSTKQITAEACVHHLYFNEMDYPALGNQIKCNPAIKSASDSLAIANALKNKAIDVVATDHAPHTWEEKQNGYSKAPSGLPLIQHSLSMMITMSDRYQWDLPFIVEKMAHNPAICFKLKKRGFIREGYYADLVVLNPTQNFTVNKADLLYKCGWSPLEGIQLKGKILACFLNGQMAYDGKKLTNRGEARRLEFNRS